MYKTTCENRCLNNKATGCSLIVCSSAPPRTTFINIPIRIPMVSGVFMGGGRIHGVWTSSPRRRCNSIYILYVYIVLFQFYHNYNDRWTIAVSHVSYMIIIEYIWYVVYTLEILIIFRDPPRKCRKSATAVCGQPRRWRRQRAEHRRTVFKSARARAFYNIIRICLQQYRDAFRGT